MKSNSTLFLLATLFLSVACPGFAGGSGYLFTANCHQVSFDGVNKLIVVKASLNGRQGWFVLDTGMKDLLLNIRHFELLSSEEVPDSISLVDAWGESRMTKYIEVEDFQWGAIHRQGFISLGTDLTTMERVLSREILGLIGTEVVRELELVVDYRNQILTMRRPEQIGGCGSCPETADYELAFAYQNHLPALKTSIGNRSEMWLGLDTGSSLSMIDTKHRRRLRRSVRTVTRIRYGSPNGIYEIPLANVDDLDLGQGLAFKYWRFGFNRLEHFHRSGMYIDGLIGGDLFRLGVVSMNFVEQTVRIWLQDNTFLKRYPELRTRLARKGDRQEAELQLACVGN